ncbi:MAG TPA: septum formation inhibitor Maf [Gammaproteobacteria bacterium]|nr:septum formation inhibitor Maf [Gammaproteobacteria bacterium]
MTSLILASTSPFRATLLERLQLPFATFAPDIDETPLPDESPEAMVRRLTAAKAEAARSRFPDRLVIASDQCAVCDGKILGKPGDHTNAVTQLTSFSGKEVRFLTGLALLNTQTGNLQLDIVPFGVHFRTLSADQIEHYLAREQPYHCAGSFKSEGLGITLFERLEGEDPNALIGLPLIRLTSFLLNEGVELP